MRRTLASLLIVLWCSIASAQQMRGVKLAGVAVSTAASAAASGMIFSPAAGSVPSGSAVAVTSTPSSGIQLFCTTDGTTATAASSAYSNPFTIALATTINCTAQVAGVTSQQVQAASAHWQCTTPVATTYGSLACQGGGGVGTNNPSNVAITFGSSANGNIMNESVSTTATSGETQFLEVFKPSGNDNTTQMAQGKWVRAIGDQTIIANNEIDMFSMDGTRNVMHMFGLQCNQQPGNADYGYWQIDSKSEPSYPNGWARTTVRAGCPWSTTDWTFVGLEGHWTNGTTDGYYGAGTETFDYLTISTCNVAPINDVCPAGHVVIAPTRTYLGTVRSNYRTGWGSLCGDQDQVDLTNTGTSGHNPTTGGRQIASNNVACTFGENTNGTASYTATSSYPVTIPGGATVYANLEQTIGWSGDSTASVSGAYAPMVCSIVPTGNGNPCPGAGGTTGGTYTGGGGGSTMVLQTTGVSGHYSGWMAKRTITTTAGQNNMLVRASFTFSSVAGIQAWEVGRRSTNASQVTDNGQTQLVPIAGSQLEFDIVPSTGGGWLDTGCRFPTFVTGTTYNEELYFVNDSSGALSLMYVSLNGTVCTIPSSMQHVAGTVNSPAWGANQSVLAFQPDANTSATPFNATVTLNAWTW